MNEYIVNGMDTHMHSDFEVWVVIDSFTKAEMNVMRVCVVHLQVFDSLCLSDYFLAVDDVVHFKWESQNAIFSWQFLMQKE